MSQPLTLHGGVEWIVDAHGCDPARLRSLGALQAVFDRAIAELRLSPIERPVWHAFGGAGGVSGLVLLAESHLACHTFPESGYASFNLYCCRPRAPWDWQARLAEALGAAQVVVQAVARPGDTSITQASAAAPSGDTSITMTGRSR